jgi:hypothetical protein
MIEVKLEYNIFLTEEAEKKVSDIMISLQDTITITGDIMTFMKNPLSRNDES